MSTKKEQAQIEVIINGQKATATIADMEKATKTLNQQIKNLTPGTAEFVKKTEELKKISGRLGDVKKDVAGVGSGIKGMLGEMERMGPAGAMLGNLRGGFSAMTGSIANVVKSCFTLTGAMIAIPIFALIAGITALIAYFKSTDEGADALEQGLAAAGAVMQVLTNIFAAAGKVLMDVFSDPKQAMLDLVEFLKNNIINRFKAFGVILEAIRNGDFKKLADGVIQLETGIENATDKAIKFKNAMVATGEEIARAAQKAADLTRQTQDLEDAERSLSVTNAERKGQIDELLLKSKEKTLSDKEGLKALKEAGELEKAMTAEAVLNAEKRLSIVREQNALKKNINDGDKDKEAAAQIKVIELLNESKIIRQTIANRESKFIQDLAAERKKALEERQKQEEDVINNIHKLELEALTDSINDRKKKLAIQAQDEENLVKGTEAEIAYQRTLIRTKLNNDLAKIDEDAQKEITKKKEEADKKLNDEFKRESLALAEYNVELAKGNADATLDAKKVQLDIEKEWELDNADLTGSERELIEKKYADEKEALEEEARQRKLEKDKELAQTIGSIGTQVIQDVNDFAKIHSNNQLAAINKEKDQRIASLDDSLAKGKISQEKYAKLKEKAENEARKKEADIKNKQAKTDKLSNIAQAVIATALAVVKALPNPFTAAIAGIMGGVQVAKIIATPLPTFKMGGWLGAMKSFFGGGVVRGSRHGANYGDGGIAMIDRITGQEKGELQGNEIILTDGVTNNPRLRAEASRLNVLGGGRSFADGGTVGSASGSSTSSNSSDAFINKLDQVIEAVNNQNSLIRAYVVLSDLEEARTTLTDIKAEAKL